MTTFFGRAAAKTCLMFCITEQEQQELLYSNGPFEGIQKEVFSCLLKLSNNAESAKKYSCANLSNSTLSFVFQLKGK